MLTDTAIKALKAQKKLYKVSDRDGMYVVVQPSGAIVFRYDYRLNGRRETLTLGRYGPDGLSLARAREKLIDAKRAISEGRSPAQEKQHDGLAREKWRAPTEEPGGVLWETGTDRRRSFGAKRCGWR